MAFLGAPKHPTRSECPGLSTNISPDLGIAQCLVERAVPRWKPAPERSRKWQNGPGSNPPGVFFGVTDGTE